MKPIKKILLFFVLANILLLTSCKKFNDFDKIASTSWNPNLAIPLAHSKFGVYDILAKLDSNDLFIINPNTGEIGLVYKSEIASFNASSIISLGDVNQNFTFSTADYNIPATPNFPGNVNANTTEVFQLNAPNNAELHTISFKSGTLNFHLSNTLKHDVSITFTFPNLLENGIPVTRNIIQTYNGTIPQVSDLQINLTDMQGDFTLNNTSFNQMEIEIQTAIMGTGQEISGNETISIDMSLSNLTYHNVTGYLGQQIVAQEPDSVLIKIFQNALGGVFQLNNPTIDFTIDNSFGFPIDITLNDLKSINTATNVITPLLNYPTTIHVNYPTVMGQSETTNFELNNNNTSNLSSIISPTPTYFYYEIDAQANPNGQTAIPNFIEDDSKFTLTAEVNMPLNGLAYGFSISDTVDFKFNQDIDFIESIMFRLIADNGFPVLLATQIRALDANNNTVFTIFDQPENVIDPAPVDNNGVVIAPVRKITDIHLNEAQINQLKNVKKLIIYGEASTTEYQNGVSVKFFDYYQFGLKLAMQVQGSTSL